MADSSPGDGPAATGKSSGRVGDVFSKKVGPLPIWGWATVGVGSLFLFRKIYSGGGSSAQAGQVNTATGATTSTSQPPVIVNQGQMPTGAVQQTQSSLPGLSPALASNLTPNEQLVIQTYQTVLGRNPEPQGYASWVNQLDKGTITPQQFVQDVQNSPEAAIQKQNAASTSVGTSSLAFYNANNAARNAGLPYAYSYQGQPVIYNPSSNTAQPIAA